MSQQEKISGGDGGYVSSNDDLERLTDNLISDTDGEKAISSNNFNNSGPITSYDNLFQTAGKQPPSDAYNFDALKSSDDDTPPHQNLDDLAFEKDKMASNQSTEEEIVFHEQARPFNDGDNQLLSPQKSVQFKNLPANPPELLPDLDNDNEEHSEDYTEEELMSGEMDGIEVTEKVEEIEEYVVVTEDDDEDGANQMDDSSSSVESKPIPDVIDETAVTEESSEYDPELEYDASEDSDDDEDDDDDDDEEDEEEGDEEEMDEKAEITLPPLHVPQDGQLYSKEANTPVTTRAVDTDDMQSEILSSDEEGLDTIKHEDFIENILAAKQGASERNEEGDGPPNGLFATAMPDEQAPERFDLENPLEPGSSKQTAASSFDEEAKRSAVKSERRKMLPYVLCLALTIIIGVIVALVIISQPDSDDIPLTVVPITQSPTVFRRTPAPSPTPAPVLSPTFIPPIFTPVNPPSPNPTQAPTESPPTVLPPLFTPTPPTPRPSPPPTLRPTRAPTATPIANTPVPITMAPVEDQANDSCTNAVGPLLADGSTVEGDFSAATSDDVDRCGDVTTQGPGVWYYVLGTGGEMMAHTCLNGRADTKITIFKGNCEKPECIGGNDNFCGLQSAVSWQSTYRQVYRILVHGPDTPSFFGSFTLSIESRVNDECETAAGPLTIGSRPLVLGNTLEANPNDIDCGQGPNVAPSVWYSIRGTGAEITASVCDGSDYDARISVLVGTCGALSCVIQSEADACSVSFASESFVEYFLMIHGSEGTDSGQFGLQLTTSAIRDNDSCENAIGPLPFDASNIVLGSTSGASADLGVAFCESASTAPGVWYYIIGSGNSIQVSLCSPSTSYDTRLSIYEGTCADNVLSGLTCITGNDDFCGRQSSVTFQSEVGVTYQILVHGYLLASGDFALTVSEV